MTYQSLASVIRSRVRSESTYKSFRSAIKSIYEKRVEKDFADQIVVGGYRTNHFEMCPGAQKLYSNLPDGKNIVSGTNVNQAETTAKVLDQLFALEKGVVATKKADGDDVRMAKEYAAKVMAQAGKMGMTAEHSFVADHVKTIEGYHTASDGNPKLNVTDADVKKALERPPVMPTKETEDADIDNQKFKMSRNLKMQRKLKIIDND